MVASAHLDSLLTCTSSRPFEDHLGCSSEYVDGENLTNSDEYNESYFTGDDGEAELSSNLESDVGTEAGSEGGSDDRFEEESDHRSEVACELYLDLRDLERRIMMLEKAMHGQLYYTPVNSPGASPQSQNQKTEKTEDIMSSRHS